MSERLLTYEEIEQLWNEDCRIDISDLAHESLRIPELHNKYYKIYRKEKAVLKIKEENYNTLKLLKKEYYDGTLNGTEILKEKGWEPFLQNILVKERPMYVEADEELQQERQKMYIHIQKMQYLEEIIKQINNRSFQIKGAIDFMRFTNGDI